MKIPKVSSNDMDEWGRRFVVAASIAGIAVMGLAILGCVVGAFHLIFG